MSDHWKLPKGLIVMQNVDFFFHFSREILPFSFIYT